MARLKGITNIPDLTTSVLQEQVFQTSNDPSASERVEFVKKTNTFDDVGEILELLTLSNNTTYYFDVRVAARLVDKSVDKGLGGRIAFTVYRNDGDPATLADDSSSGVLKEIETYGSSNYDFDLELIGNTVNLELFGEESEVVGWTINANIIKISASSNFVASGGTITEIEDGGNDYRVHTFTDLGTDDFQIISGSGDIEYLIVAGGGGGGTAQGDGNVTWGGSGGGGAGGLLEGQVGVSVGTYTVTVGDGGNPGASGGNNSGNNGQNSSIVGGSVNIVATGGGGGGRSAPGASDNSGEDGGSGGGGGAGNGPAGATTSGGAATSGQGFAGGAGQPDNALPYMGAGGGGATEVGADGGTVPGVGKGGDGKASTITGTSIVYAGGGGAGGATNNFPGGDGGGGVGGHGSAFIAATAGQNNRGSGGGGGAASTSTTPRSGAKGGSGIVVIRYQI